MTKYRVTTRFLDLADNRHYYKVGDEYPRKGLYPSDVRIAQLLGSNNNVNHPVIEKIDDTEAENEEVKSVKKRRKDTDVD